MSRNQSRASNPQSLGHKPAQAGELPAPAISYVAGVIGGSVLAIVLTLVFNPPQSLSLILMWGMAALAGELLVFSTATGRAQINLATSVHLAMILALPAGDMVVALLLSRTLAKFVFQRQAWYRALFNVAQCTGATLAAAGVLALLAEPVTGTVTVPILQQLAPGFLSAVAVYYLLNTFSVSGVVALTSGDTIWRAWRENYGYLAEMAGTAALVLFSPLMLLSWQILGWPGLLIFLAPTVFVKITSERYVALRRAHQEAIACERLAAKGEIATEVGHEINNHLTAIYCQVHLLANGAGSGGAASHEGMRNVLARLDQINSLSQGLMESTQKETHRAPVRLDSLIERTVSFLRPQSRFDGVDIRLDLDPRMGEVRLDATQIQQVIMNLMLNASGMMNEAGSSLRRLDIGLRRHDVSRQVEITVADSGPGVSEELRGRIFEPGFSTRASGRGFGLSTSLCTIQNHGGRISVEDSMLGGALFRVTLPLETETLRRAA